ncbi:MAG: hypothetical protein ACRENG_26585, partial [bacterium]
MKKTKTTIVPVLASALICFYISTLQAQANQVIGKPSEGLIIRNVTVISPERAGALKNGTVVITGGHIVSVGAEKPAASLKNHELINGD